MTKFCIDLGDISSLERDKLSSTNEVKHTIGTNTEKLYRYTHILKGTKRRNDNFSVFIPSG